MDSIVVYVNHVHEWIQNCDYLHNDIVSDNEATTTNYSSIPITQIYRIQTPAEQQEER